MKLIANFPLGIPSLIHHYVVKNAVISKHKSVAFTELDKSHTDRICMQTRHLELKKWSVINLGIDPEHFANVAVEENRYISDYYRILVENSF